MADITTDGPRKKGENSLGSGPRKFGEETVVTTDTTRKSGDDITSRKIEDDDPDTPRNRGDGDAPHLTPTTPAEDARTVLLNQISWGAVLAGVVVMLTLQLILNMIGIGVGAGSFDIAAAASPNAAASNNPSLENFSTGAAVWWVLTGVIASFVGGYAAGRLAGVPKESTAGWHGITAWAAATLIVLYLVTSALGTVMGGAYRTVTDAASAATAAGTQGAQNGAFGGIEQTIRNALGGGAQPTQDAVVSSIRALVTGDQAQQAQAREQAAQAIAQAQQVPIEEARNRVVAYEAQYRQSVQTAARNAEEAKDTVANSALVGAAALILGAIAAWFGGRSGAVHPTLTDAVLRGRQLRAPFERRSEYAPMGSTTTVTPTTYDRR